MLRMLKFAQSAEYAQKNTAKSLPVTHVIKAGRAQARGVCLRLAK